MTSFSLFTNVRLIIRKFLQVPQLSQRDRATP